MNDENSQERVACCTATPLCGRSNVRCLCDLWMLKPANQHRAIDTERNISPSAPAGDRVGSVPGAPERSSRLELCAQYRGAAPDQLDLVRSVELLHGGRYRFRDWG
jgi:hypothetical protein